MPHANSFPDHTDISSEEQLDDLLTTPRPELIRFIRTVQSPLIVLGAGGKMGPTLAVLAKRAADAAGHPLEVLAVSRFSNAAAREWLESQGVKTLSCDLLDRGQVQRLPRASNVIYLVGLKFGTGRNPALTWAVNTLAPAYAAEHYREARIVALSTGNVYPMVDVKAGGATEAERLTPLGEYANAAVARERIFQYYADRHSTRMAILRLFYAVELRYGVVADIARKVHRGEEIDLAAGWFNCIWQGDANEMILRSLALAETPPRSWNLCRPEIYSVREVAERLGELLRTPPRFRGTECATALVANATAITTELGTPSTPMETILRRTVAWIRAGGRDLGRPTHFEVRDGNY